MDLKPIHIVDTLAVTPDKQMALLKVIKEEGIPVMQSAGFELVGCYSTSPDLDEDVLIQVTWKVGDHSEFNLKRKAESNETSGVPLGVLPIEPGSPIGA